MTKEELLEKANSLPLAPGVYLMQGQAAEKPGEPVFPGRPRPQPENPDYGEPGPGV